MMNQYDVFRMCCLLLLALLVLYMLMNHLLILWAFMPFLPALALLCA